MKFSNEKMLLLFFILYFVIQLFLAQNYTMVSDEGTHGSISLFFKSLINNLKNFKSFDDITEFVVDYAIKYPKITPIYPPLYHTLLTGVFFIKESVFLGRILSLLITLLTAFAIYKLALEILKDKNSALISSISFLVFSTIFKHASLLYTDIIQILTFILALLYYLKLKKRKNVSLKNIIFFSLLLVVAFLTKFFSVFLPFIIVIDSFFSKRKFFKYVLISLILSLILISPYMFLYVKFKLYKFTLKVAMNPFLSRWNYLDIFTNFGILMGLIVVGSTIWFLYNNRKNLFILTWFLIPAVVFLISTHSSIRFAYILMPIFALSCGFLVKNIYRTKKWKKALLFVVITFLGLQLLFDIFANYYDFVYPVEEITRIFSTLPDFDKDKTTYQINFAKKKGYIPHACETLKSLDLCMARKANDKLCLEGYTLKSTGMKKLINHPLSYVRRKRFFASLREIYSNDTQKVNKNERA